MVRMACEYARWRILRLYGNRHCREIWPADELTEIFLLGFDSHRPLYSRRLLLNFTRRCPGRREGRPAEDGQRELVLSPGRYGYVAKYRWVPAEDVVLILAVRHQLEAGYKEE
jgi:hypothetical protein